MKPPVAPQTFFGYFSGSMEQVFPPKFITSGDRLSPYPVMTSIDEDAGKERNSKCMNFHKIEIGHFTHIYIYHYSK